MKRLLSTLILTCSLVAMAGVAQALTVAGPGFAVSVPLYVGVAPAPVYVAPPPPVYVAPAYVPPPPPVYVAPAYVPPPVWVAPRPYRARPRPVAVLPPVGPRPIGPGPVGPHPHFGPRPR
ncbi:conserved hypothetical protein [Solidesulfovibrio fructosivorans JJ]]|uniref:Uncharacterized protein n=1 Tax=Solidesulfovibrio fructosivorans JJ] TaxID=596151 RepID=E1K087_SOLFR|nr:hypothetical protein [Solidesulfovibrio fructosivorans]EFL50005.1 conserved hypothetical protein [Solidesulfovibrio fructosivorans JJ]]